MMYLFLISAFEDFFPKLDLCSNRFIYGTNLHDYYVPNCVFWNLSSPTHGGVFNFNTAAIKLVIEDCMFYRCITASYYGGSIYIQSSLAGIALSKICAVEGFTVNGYEGQFSYSSTSVNQPNSLYFVSFSGMGGGENSRCSSIHNYYGNQSISHCNSSYQNTYYYSSFSIGHTTSCVLKFCTSSSNKGSYGDIYLLGTGIKLITFSIVFNNTSPSVAIIYVVTGLSNMTFSYLKSNFNTLFMGPISISNSQIDHSGLFLTGTQVLLLDNNSIGSNQHTPYIEHFSTYLCHIETPPPSLTLMIENLSPCQTLPNPPTPHQTNPNECSQLFESSFLNYYVLFNFLIIL